MDVDEGRLGRITRLAGRYAAELGVDLRFEQTLERERALREADFVLNTALDGGHDPEEAGRRLAGTHGYYRGVRLQTNLRQYALMLSVARDVERLCPRAWIIQSSNPVFEGCTLMTRETGARVIGLCHGFYGYQQLARAIGVPPEEVEWEIPGVNHWVYLTRFRHHGEDLYPRIDRWIEEEADAYWAGFQGRFGETQLSRGVDRPLPARGADAHRGCLAHLLRVVLPHRPPHQAPLVRPPGGLRQRAGLGAVSAGPGAEPGAYP